MPILTIAFRCTPTSFVISISHIVDKSEFVPAQRLQFIGAVFDTQQAMMLVSHVRWMKILRYVPLALKQPLQLWQWQQLLGLLTSAQARTIWCQLHQWPPQCFLLPYIRIDDCLIPTDHLPPHLQWWLIESYVCDGVSLRQFILSLHLFRRINSRSGIAFSRSSGSRMLVHRGPLTLVVPFWPTCNWFPSMPRLANRQFHCLLLL